MGTKFRTWGMPRRRCKTLRERSSLENGKRVDEGINSTWRGRVSPTKHEQKIGSLDACRNIVLSSNKK